MAGLGASVLDVGLAVTKILANSLVFFDNEVAPACVNEAMNRAAVQSFYMNNLKEQLTSPDVLSLALSRFNESAAKGLAFLSGRQNSAAAYTLKEARRRLAAMTGTAVAPAGASAQWITGVPNEVVIGGGVLVALTGTVLALRRKK